MRPKSKYLYRPKPWPQEYAADYETLKVQLDTITGLIERSSIFARYREREYLRTSIPMIAMIARRLLRSGIEISAWQRGSDTGGGYWINDVLVSINWFAPEIEKWAAEIEELISRQIWTRIEERLKDCLQAVYRIQFGYDKEDGSRAASGLLTGPGPSTGSGGSSGRGPDIETNRPIDDSLIRDAEAWLAWAWTPGQPREDTEARARKKKLPKPRKPPKDTRIRKSKSQRGGGRGEAVFCDD